MDTPLNYYRVPGRKDRADRWCAVGGPASRGWLLILLVACILPGSLRAAEISDADIANRRCMNCHGQSRLASMPGSQRAGMVAPSDPPPAAAPRQGLYLESDALSGSVHEALACVSCHRDAETLPHVVDLKPATCGGDDGCHVAAVSDMLQGAHATALAQGNAAAPTCSTCHGTHQVLPSDDRKSLTHSLNIAGVCGDCHAQYTSPTTNGHDGRVLVEQYLQSVHGKAITQGGLAVAATCADCHGPHKVLPSSDPASTVNRTHIAETCGTCHTGLSEVFELSVHGQLLTEGDARGPVCSDCHTAHAITATDQPGFMLDISAECGTCHADLYDSYRRSYHGQVMELGDARAARCSDCHSAHDVKRVEAADSPLNADNRVEACRSCHANANANFAMFEPHADHRDRQNFPILYGVWMYFVVMMSASFGFFGLHCILWFIRSFIERLRNGRHPHVHYHPNERAIQRFNRVDRFNHALVIISFFGLTITGLPLLYSDKQWAQWVFQMLGGVRSAGILHRVFAVMLIANFVIHGIGLLRRIRKHGLRKLLFGPATMLPTRKDLADVAGMFRWFFKGGKKPKFDRWTYWEKFDYVAEVGGSGIIGLSGLMLWFPEFFANFLPGWMFNVATIVHGYEALLAIGFIFTIHFFNAHLRLEKFPVDDVMFTGRLPEQEFREERGAEYDRLVASGELESLKVLPPPVWYRRVAVLAGIVAMAIGTTLVILIVLAGIGVI